MEASERSYQEDVKRINEEIETSKNILNQRLPEIDNSVNAMKTTLEKLKTTISSATKYSEETMQHNLQRITIAPELILPKTIYYPAYVMKPADNSA